MAVQMWTIFKLVGPAGEDAAARFDRWLAKRRPEDAEILQAKDWHPSTRRAVAAYLGKLEAHALEMPSAYFAKHADLWSFGGQMGMHLPGLDDAGGVLQTCVEHDGGMLWCYRLPDRGKLVRRNRKLMAGGQFEETQWLAARLVEAAVSWAKLFPRAMLLINRRAVTASPTDDEVRAQASLLPAWLEEPSGG